MNDDLIDIEKPCHENLEKMDSVSGGKFCHSCSCKVHEVSQLTREEATDLLREQGKVCLRIRRNRKGKILFRRRGTTLGDVLGAITAIGILAIFFYPVGTHGAAISNEGRFRESLKRVTLLREMIREETNPEQRAVLLEDYQRERKRLKEAAERYRASLKE